MSSKPVKHTAKSICASLRGQILNWTVLPGQRFTEKALCDEFSVSRIPVREALSMLIDTGLVIKERNVGCRVRELSERDINHLYELRTALELYAVEILAALPDAETRISGLRREWSAYAETAASAQIDPVFWCNADEHFHEALLDALENPVLSRALHDVNEQLRFLRMKDITTHKRLLRTCKAHQAILESIEKGDPPEARKRLRQNIRMGRNNVKESFGEMLRRARL